MQITTSYENGNKTMKALVELKQTWSAPEEANTEVSETTIKSSDCWKLLGEHLITNWNLTLVLTVFTKGLTKN